MSSPSFDHLRTPRWHWWIVISAGLLTLVCGTIGGVQYDRARHPGEPLTVYLFLGALYTSMQMLVLHSPHFEAPTNPLLELGRWLGIFALAWTACLLLLDRLRHEIRLLRLAGWNQHHVILGLGHKGMAIIDSIKKGHAKAKVVVIDPNPEHSFVDRCVKLGVCILRMDAAESDALEMARVSRAGEIISVAGEDETNVRIAAEVRQIRQQSKAPRAFCRVHISSSYLSSALQEWTDAVGDPATTLRFFDVYDSEARRVLLKLPRENAGESGECVGHAPIDGAGIGPLDDRAVHVVILGMGRMGSSLVQRAAKMGHFANARPIRISVIDRNADRQREQLFFRYPVLAKPNQGCDLKLHQLQADSLETREKIHDWANEPKTLLHVFVCLDTDARAVEIGLRLWEIIKENPLSYLNIRIKSQASLAPILKSAGTRIQAFGMLEDTCTQEAFRAEWNETIAIVIHEDFAAARKKQDPARRDDAALVPWDRLRDDYRESNRQQADHMFIKMRAIGCRIVDANAPGVPVTEFTAQEVEMLAELEHRRWNAERWLSGWTYGDPTDKVRRIHKCLVPWQQLPDEIQEYDRETIRKMPAWLAKVSPAMKLVRGGGP
jgi:hypothetical protein